MSSPRDALDAVGLLPDVEIDVANAALHFARIDQPDSDWQLAEQHLSDLACEAVARSHDVPPRDLLGRATVLTGLLVGEHGYRGDSQTYDDPANANLIRVVERRRGLPVAIGIVWLHCARAAGWLAYGLDFPGHFLVALGSEPTGRRHRPPTAQQIVLDVFAGGIPLGPDEMRLLLKHVAGASVELRPGVLQPMSVRRVLLRLQENIRARRLRDGDVTGALVCTLDMVRIAPDLAPLWRDAARMHELTGTIDAAIHCHERFIALIGDNPAAEQARTTISRLRGRLN